LDFKSQTDNTIPYDERKLQACELGIAVKDHTTLEELEKEIAKKLQEGIKQLKFIIDEIDN
jgi:hypothetical protein